MVAPSSSRRMRMRAFSTLPNTMGFPDGVISAFRPIVPSPALLVGPHKHNHKLFADRWKDVLKPGPRGRGCRNDVRL